MFYLRRGQFHAQGQPFNQLADACDILLLMRLWAEAGHSTIGTLQE